MSQFLSCRGTVLAAAVLTLLCPGPAAAQVQIPIQGHGVGQLLPFDPQNPSLQAYTVDGVLNIAGRGNGGESHFINPLDPSRGQVLKGRFDITNRDGSTFTGTYEGVYEFISDTVAEFTVSVHWEGGGRLEGVTGVS